MLFSGAVNTFITNVVKGLNINNHIQYIKSALYKWNLVQQRVAGSWSLPTRNCRLIRDSGKPGVKTGLELVNTSQGCVSQLLRDDVEEFGAFYFKGCLPSSLHRSWGLVSEGAKVGKPSPSWSCVECGTVPLD